MSPLTSFFLLFPLFLLHTAHSRHLEQDSHAATAAGTGSSDAKSDKVYLRSITALIFSENARTKSQFGPGNQQLKCVGGSAAGFWWFTEYYPHMVQCKNIGWDGASIQWGCEAELSEYVEFGPDTQVICEPYNESNRDDGYVLRGSCRLRYTLNFKKFHISFVHVMYGTSISLDILAQRSLVLSFLPSTWKKC